MHFYVFDLLFEIYSPKIHFLIVFLFPFSFVWAFFKVYVYQQFTLSVSILSLVKGSCQVQFDHKITFLKQSFTAVLQNRFSYKFCKFHRKTPVLGLKACNVIKKRRQHRFYKKISSIKKFFRTKFFYRTSLVAASDFSGQLFILYNKILSK